MNLTQRQLRMFATTARLGSVSRAGEALHITQPALTRALQDFEAQLGSRLFRRDGRGIALTPQGERFLPVAERLLREMAHALDDLHEAAGGLRGTVTLATGAAFGCSVVPLALQALARDHPGVRIRLHEDDSRGIVERVARAEADLGVASAVGDTSPLDCQPLLRAPIGLLFDARRFALDEPLRDAALRALPLLKEPPGTSILHALRARGSALVAQMEAGVEVSSLAMQIALAHAGVGVAVVSALGASHPSTRGLRFLPLRPAVERETFLLARRDREPTPAMQAVAQQLRAAVARARLHPLVCPAPPAG